MKTFKIILQLLLVVIILGYFVCSSIYCSHLKKHEVCKDLRVEIKDSTQYGFITPSEVDKMLAANGLNPRGVSRRDIDLNKIEAILSNHPAVRKVKCYISPSAMVHIDVYQRHPLFRVMGMQSYFIDEDGKQMPLFSNNAVYVPIVTGSVTPNDIEGLCQFVQFLNDDDFWGAQVVQIDLSPKKEIELTTRVGNQQLLLGTLDNYENKLSKMKAVYEKALPSLDWNVYKKFDLRYKNQVIGIK